MLLRSTTCPRSPLSMTASREHVGASEGMPPTAVAQQQANTKLPHRGSQVIPKNHYELNHSR